MVRDLRRRNNNRKKSTGVIVANFFVQLVIFMCIFAVIGIVMQSTILISLGFITSVILAAIINFFKVSASVVYIVSIVILVILLIFVPKILF